MPRFDEPIAYAYEADCHCPSCARERFGGDPEDAYDNEGNRPSPIFGGDEWWNTEALDICQTLECSDCGLDLDHLCPEEPDDGPYIDEDRECDCEDCLAAAEYSGGDT